jgi:hypothetical protein
MTITNMHSGKHRDLQRLTVPYARLLGVIDDQAFAADGASSDANMEVEL